MYEMTTYLTEKPLGDILRTWAGAENVKTQPFVPGTRMRNDYEVTKNGLTFVVEFNGDSHYRDPTVILRDWTKAEISRKLGKIVVDIPYFVQLDELTFPHYFNDDFAINTTFPHGFVTTKMLPASFCPLGYNRAVHEIEHLPKEVTHDIMKSLETKAASLGVQQTYFRNSVVLETGEELAWENFVKKANEIHNNQFIYIHPL
jgi:hypothetical protein